MWLGREGMSNNQCVDDRLLARILDIADDAIIVIDDQQRIILFNRGAERIFGYGAEEILGQPLDLLMPESLARVHRRHVEEFSMSATASRHKDERRELMGRRKDGTIFPAEISISKLDQDGKITFMAILRDISDRKMAEEQIQRQLQRLNALRSIDLAITSSLDPRVTFNVLLDQVTTQLEVDAAAILRFDRHTRTLTFVACRGFRTSALRHTRLRIGEGHAGRAALDRRLVIIPNLAEAEGSFVHSPQMKNEGFVSYFAAPLLAKGTVQGVLELFHRSPLTPDTDWIDFLESLAAQAAIAIDNASLFEELRRSNVELVQAYDATLEGWSRALELRDLETSGHSLRVTEITVRIASAMGISEQELVHVRRGTLLHDIGKMGIPDAILLKPGPLTEEEWEIMRKHPVYAFELLSPIPFLRPALDIPYCHHERWDGSGYPRGLKGEEIPLAARIFAVVDVWDALRSPRPYREAWPEDKVRQYLRRQAGKQLDPRVVEKFLAMIDGLLETLPPDAESEGGEAG